MNNAQIYTLIDSCIFLTDERKDFLKQNFCIYPEGKQERIISMLEKASKISASPEDFEVFSYGIKIWKEKRKLEFLEAQDRELWI